MTGAAPTCPQCGLQSMFMAYDGTWRCQLCYRQEAPRPVPLVMLERIATALEQSVEIQRRTLDLLERAGLMNEGDR